MAVSGEPEVRVAFKRIWDLVEEGRSWIGVVFRPDDAKRWSLLEDPGLMDVVDAARLRANDSTPEEGTDSLHVSPSPYGPMMVLDEPGDWEQARTWFTTLATTLAQAGRSGTVEPADGQVHMPEWVVRYRGVAAKLTAYTALTLREPFPTGPLTSLPQWSVTPTTTQTLCQQVVTWCAQVSAATVYLTQGRSEVALDDPQSPLLLASTVEIDGHAGICYARKEPHASRALNLSPWGQACYIIDDEDLDWQTRLDALLQVVVPRAADLDLAVIRLAPTWAHSWISLDLGNPALPYVSESKLRTNRQLWDQFTPDAHGAQILTGAHLSRAHNLDAWNTRALGSDRYLVTAPDLTPWYSGAEPDPEVLPAARADFGAMIITPEAIREHAPRR